MKTYSGKNFSIMGDSISTFFGYSPKSFYGIGNLAERNSGVNSVDDTWWMQVINALGGRLLFNNSYSGSLVAAHGECAAGSWACSDKRTSRLGENGVAPDVIMIYAGTNDSGWGIEIDGAEGDGFAFKSAYALMLDKIKRNYPEAEIWCFTLCRRAGADCGYMGGYCNAIRDCARAAGCKIIELYDSAAVYETCDGLHPNADGMKTIAESVLAQVQNREGKIYVTGDTHRSDLLCVKVFCDNHPELTKNDYIIIAGDFGGVWAESTLERDLKQFTDLPVTVLFVDGNHENFDLINAYPVETWKGGKVHKIKPDVIHLMRGQVYEISGKTIFTFGGATSIDKYLRKEGESWWSQELPTYEELDEGFVNLKRYGNRVDYIITHSCGQRALTYPQLRITAGIKTASFESNLLSNFEDTVEFKHWYFGHFHIDAQLSDKFIAIFHCIKEL